MVKIKHAAFIKSAAGLHDSLPESKSEIVFLGRSNVGKSSLINMVANRQGLAKSSSTPGKTQLINFFDFIFSNDDNEQIECRLVDLPGFGYAKVSHDTKEKWQRNLTHFLQNRFSIRLFCHLIDARHPNLEIDQEVAEFLDDLKRPDQQIVQIITKIDKLGQGELVKLKRLYPHALLASSSKNKGAEAIRQMMIGSIGFLPKEEVQ